MSNDWGIVTIGKNRHQIRVARIEKRTGLLVNRKLTVSGSKQDARAARDRLCAELESTAVSRPRTRLQEYALSWLAQRVARLKGTTSRRYDYSLRHILPALGQVYLDALTPADVSQYVAARVKAVGVKGGHSVLNELRTLRTIAKDALAEGYCDRDWTARVSAPRVMKYTRDRPNLLTPEQFKAIIDEIPAKWRGFVLLLVTTGLRWGEASALRRRDIVGGEAIVTRHNDRGVETTPKTDGSYRSVPVLPGVLELLPDKGLLCPNRIVGQLHTGYPLVKILRAACKAAGVPRVTVHGLRRTFNNEARKHTSREVLKSITGHTTDAMVEHYSMVAPKERLAASTAVARSIGLAGRVPNVSAGRRSKQAK
jgi:integrase